jgi:hypothetical protein
MDDMLRYLRANVHPPDNALGRAIRASHQLQRPVQGAASIGLGWQRLTLDGRTILMHGGGTGGYNTNIAFEPARGIGIILLTNTTGFDDDLDRDFLRRGLPLPVADVAVSRGTLQRYVGAYELAPGRVLHIRLEEAGTLTLQAPGNVRFRLYAETDSTFVVKRAPWRVAFAGDSIAFDVEGTVRRGVRTSLESPPPAEVAGNAMPDVVLTRAEAERYVGSYALNLGDRTLGLRVFVQGRGLAAQADGQGANPLRYLGDHTFVLEADNNIRLVFVVEGDRAVSVTLHQAGRTAVGPRS